MLTVERVAGILRGRMRTPPPLPQIRIYLQGLTREALVQEEVRLDRICRGVDDEGLIELVDAIQAARLTEVRPDPAPAAPDREHDRRKGRALERDLHKASVPEGAPVAQRPAIDAAFLRAHGIHVYGATGSLKIELDVLRRDVNRQDAVYTIQVEGAKKRSAGEGYAWDRKIAIQLTRSELVQLAAFLLGFAGADLQFRNHGPHHNKALTLQDQGCRLFVRISESAQTLVAVPVEPPDVFAWGELCLVALGLNRPTLPMEAHLALLRRLGAMTMAVDTQAR